MSQNRSTFSARVGASLENVISRTLPDFFSSPSSSSSTIVMSSSSQSSENSQRQFQPSSSAPSDSPNHYFAREKRVYRDDESFITEYICSCGKKFTTQKNLAGHVLVKETGKLFECTLCFGRFSTHPNLTRHMHRVHGDTSYRFNGCHFCGKIFNSETERKTHKRWTHRRKKLDKPKVGPDPPPKQPRITNFFRRRN